MALTSSLPTYSLINQHIHRPQGVQVVLKDFIFLTCLRNRQFSFRGAIRIHCSSKAASQLKGSLSLQFTPIGKVVDCTFEFSNKWNPSVLSDRQVSVTETRSSKLAVFSRHNRFPLPQNKAHCKNITNPPHFCGPILGQISSYRNILISLGYQTNT